MTLTEHSEINHSISSSPKPCGLKEYSPITQRKRGSQAGGGETGEEKKKKSKEKLVKEIGNSLWLISFQVLFPYICFMLFLISFIF
jgi:hypothetical protein